MKKFLVIMIAAVALAFGSVQQTKAQGALGLRLGGGEFFGAEISWLTAMDANRWEVDGSFGGGNHWMTIGVTGAYHWDWNIVAGLNWFVGPAAQVRFLFADNHSSDICLGIGGQIGLEYDFSDLGAPIQLSLDLRPLAHFYLLNHYDVPGHYRYFGWDAALGIRYVF